MTRDQDITGNISATTGTGPVGRGSHMHPPNRFDGRHNDQNLEDLEYDEEYLASLDHPKTEYLPDSSKTVVSENDSPDVGFRYSVNPYRGCSHGCAYCYARPGHEYLGLNAGLDFETKIFVKHDAPHLLREFLARPSWQPEVIVFSGVTDCYQPAERQFKITRGCLEVALAARQPVGIITKNALLVRDLDLLAPMSEMRLVHANVSITTLDENLARTMEPRTSTPSAKLRAIEKLTAAGVPVRVMVAPIIPGLTDSEIPAILKAARDAGARAAGYVLLRLPLTVAPVFQEWLERTQPTRRKKVEDLIRGTRNGQLYNSQFKVRQRGTGPMAEQIGQTFKVFVRKHGLDRPMPAYDTTLFRPPAGKSGQLRLF